MSKRDDAIGKELLNVPLGDLLRSVTMAIADAQFQLDKSSIRMAEFMSGKHVLRGPDDAMVDEKGAPATQPTLVDSRVYFGYTYDEEGKRIPQQLSMMELGFVPNFYQFVDTVIELKIAMRVNRGKDPGSELVLTSTPVDAGYASSYGYEANLACVFKTKLVPIPPPATLTERLRLLVAEQEAAEKPPPK